VLVVDDDPDLVRFVEVNLRFEGFETASAADGEAALKRAGELRPDLILLEVGLPEIDGYEVVRRLRAGLFTQQSSIIMLTGKTLSADKVVGLTAGADDYILKPFDPLELMARVKSTLHRAEELRAANPLTRLPGNARIQSELKERVATGAQFALMYIDLDNFKAFNDHAGFLRGDGAIKLLAECILSSASSWGGETPFVGHVGGDDFVAVIDAPGAETVAKDIVACWDRQVAGLYEAPDVERGYIEVPDRMRRKQHFPLSRVSIGIASNLHRNLTSHWEAVEIATEMKQFAKRQEASSYAFDRRQDQAIVLDEQSHMALEEGVD
jgi:diguanylate cyclase (GGDEF)-like protein